MSNRMPASLAYLLIYNPTLPPPPNAARDDEDVKEEAHVLFYTSRERVMARDRMLRQVGLAKALVNFSGIFTPEQGCDSVHSQGKRLVSISPEPDFWMHICVDLAKTPKPDKTKKKTLGSNELAYYYHEESVHDLALRGYLQRGYEDFKLLHGTYTLILKDCEPGTLERYLEHFFTAWAWQWDFEAVNDFTAHLGLPLRPLKPSLSSIISSFLSELPSNTIPILLSPPYIIEPSQASVTSYPPSLLRYLLSLKHSPSRPRPPFHRRPSTGQDPSNSGTTSRHSNFDTVAPNNIHGFLSVSGANMGQVLNVKKWAWPGSLTFGKTGPASRNKQLQDLVADNSGPQNKLRATTVKESNSTTKMDEQVNGSEDCRTHVEGKVDQSALDDAMSNLPLSQQAIETTVAVEQDVRVEGQIPRFDESQPNIHPPVAPQQSDNVVSSAPDCAKSTPLRAALSQPSLPNFSTLTVFLAESSRPLVVQRRQVLHISLFQLVFALIVDVEWHPDEVDENLESLAHRVSGFLETVRGAIDGESMQSASDASKYIICPSDHIISSNAVLSTRSSFFFENQQTLTRHSDTLEKYSRSTTPQHWFVARRGLGFDKAGEEIPGEAYLQMTNKEASLIDADNELVGVIRRWVHGEG